MKTTLTTMLLKAVLMTAMTPTIISTNTSSPTTAAWTKPGQLG
jgi:hypothetical protein